MRIYICDDNLGDINLLTGYINKFALSKSCEFNIKTFISSEELFKAFNDTDHPNIIFLDIYIDDILGIDIAKKLYSLGYTGIIIFTTTSLDFALESYKINADGYLCKPFSYDEFSSIFSKVFTRIEHILKTTTFISNRIELTVYLKDIIYIESGNHCSLVHAKNKILKTSKNISTFYDELCANKEFMRCHQSYIINLNHASSFNGNTIIMDNNDEVLVSIRDNTKIKKQFADFFWSQT